VYNRYQKGEISFASKTKSVKSAHENPFIEHLRWLPFGLGLPMHIGSKAGGEKSGG